MIRKLHAIELQTPSPRRLLEFYRDALGLVPRRALVGDLLEVSCAGTSLRLIPSNGPVTPSRLFFTVPGPMLDTFKGRLLGQGIPLVELDQGIELKDPDGNRILLMPDREPPWMPGRKGLGRRVGDEEDGWARLYEDMPVEHMPWYSEDMDMDLAWALCTFSPPPCGLLELGSGPGNTAARLAALGYDVLAVDIAPAAVEYARKRFGGLNPRLRYEVADATSLSPGLGTFDGALDRGCFHSLPVEKRKGYIRSVHSVLRAGGRLVLKTFSRDEPGQWGPHRFSASELEDLFQGLFKPLLCERGVFPGRSCPKALLMVFESKA